MKKAIEPIKKTSLTMPAALMREVKVAAAQRGTTITAMAIEGLRLVLAKNRNKGKNVN